MNGPDAGPSCPARIPFRRPAPPGCREVLRTFPGASFGLVLASLQGPEEVRGRPGQLGHLEGYEAFLDELDKVWREAYRVLAPGGRLVIVVGDTALPRRRYGRHPAMPLHADIQVRCRRWGFGNLHPRPVRGSLMVSGLREREPLLF